MTLSDFLAEIRTELNEFEEYWLLEHQRDPGGFPLEFSDDNSGDWIEQFMIWQSNPEPTSTKEDPC